MTRKILRFIYIIPGRILFNLNLIAARISNMPIIIEYPKSGITWVTTVLSDYLEKPVLNYKGAIIYHPQIKNLFSRIFSTKIIKTHLFDNYNYPKKYIYLQRDVKDVMVSYFHHEYNKKVGFFKNKKIKLQEKDIKDIFFQYLKYKLEGRNFPYMNIFEHKNQFIRRNRDIMIINFEDLKKDALSEFKKILLFYDVPVNEDKLNEIINNNTIEKMRKKSKSYKGMKIKEWFFRKGKIGDWTHYFSKESLKLLEEKNAEG